MRPDGEPVRGIGGAAGGPSAASPARVDLSVTLDAKAASVMADAARKLKNRFSIGKPPGALPVKDERGECIGVTPAAKRAKLADENVAPGAKSSVPVRTPPAGDFRGARIASLEDSAERLTTNANDAAAAARVERSTEKQPARLEETRSPTAAEAARARARTNYSYAPGDADKNERAAHRDADDADVAAAAVAALAKKPQAVDVHWFPARSKDVSGPPGFKLDRAIELVLRETGVPELYSHQKAACDAVLRDKKSVVIATPTASGKSLGYVVPLLTRLSERRSSRAMLLFPLKALANDQLEKLRRFTETAGRLADSGAYDDDKNASLLRRLRAIASVSAAVCDGDSDARARAAIRSERTQIVLTNPDALHHIVLPGFVTKKFSRAFFQNLEFVVVDEAHAHTGVEGSHVANVLRRLLRICRECDNVGVRFICTSATVANPAEHVRALTTVEPAAVTESGAPRARRAAILWRPPALPRKKTSASNQRDDEDKDALSDDISDDADAPVARRSALAEAADVVADLVRRRASCLCFVTARTLVESVCRDVRQRLMRSGDQALALRVDSYRGGYGAEERRSIERRLKNGELYALITTSALEMGIDVGALDATVHVGVPQTASSMWQQVGRAGRRDASSVAVVIANETPLDAYFLDSPKELWHRAPEPAVVDPANVAILEQHLPCASFEAPVDVKLDSPVFDDAAAARRARETAASASATKAGPYQTPYLLALRRALAPTPADLPAAERNGGWNDGTPLLVLDAEKKKATCRAGYRPHADVSLRGFPRDGHDWIVLDVTRGSCIKDGAVEVERVAPRDAARRVYPGCLFSCRKGTFRVVGPLELRDRVARCVRAPPAEARRRWTSPMVRVVVEPLAPDPKKGVPPRLTRVVRGATRVAAGRVAVTERVVGYVSSVRGEHASRLNAERQRTTYPEPLSSGAYATDGVWWRFPRDALSRIPGDKIKEAAWGVLNLARALAPSFASCDARDVGGTVIVSESGNRDVFDDDGRTNAGDELVVTLCLYDAVPGGVGLASRLFHVLGDAWDVALDAVSRCACAEGCPSCVRAGRTHFVETDKKYARVALEAMTAAWLRGA